MSGFDYAKGYCLFAAPGFLALSRKVRLVHSHVAELLKDKRQRKGTLLVPLDEGTREELDQLTTLDLAQVARASYFVGHWRPSLLPRLFPGDKGSRGSGELCGSTNL